MHSTVLLYFDYIFGNKTAWFWNPIESNRIQKSCEKSTCGCVKNNRDLNRRFASEVLRNNLIRF